MTQTTTSDATNADRELVTSRTLDFPRELVFRAWTEAEHLSRWWGPNGFTNTFHEFDPRPGGRWEFVMHGPEGGNYPNKSMFVEVVKPERIVIDHLSSPQFQIIGTFEAQGDKTKITFRMLFATKEECAKLRPFVVDKNEENLDRLTTELTRMTAG
jgi:uncharacterized protein YndB with AHSA1/START domain